MQDDNNNEGWVKLHRGILKWEWWDDKNTSRFFIYCLLKANHEDVRWHGKVIERGSFIAGRTSLAKGVGISERQVRTSLERLKTTGELTTKTTNKYTIITITNYDRYQVNEKAQRPTECPTNDQQTTNKRPTNDHKQEGKEYKEIKENNIVSPNGDMLVETTNDEIPPVEEDNIDYKKLVAYWNEKTQCRFGKLISIENNRRKLVKARIRQYGKEKFIEAIHIVSQSDFLASWGGFNFDWMIKPNNFDKVISGNYNNKENNNGRQSTTERPQEIADASQFTKHL